MKSDDGGGDMLLISGERVMDALDGVRWKMFSEIESDLRMQYLWEVVIIYAVLFYLEWEGEVDRRRRNDPNRKRKYEWRLAQGRAVRAKDARRALSTAPTLALLYEGHILNEARAIP